MFKTKDLLEVAGSSMVRYSWRRPTDRVVPTCLSYLVEGNRLRVPGKLGAIQFAFPIGDIVETDGAIVICLAVPPDRKRGENVYAIDRDGNLLWQVKPQRFDSREGPYIGLSLNGEFVRLHTRNGGSRDLDPKTGLQTAA